ncbi:RNA polymerase sigma factor SigJ [Plantactinospora soyae]|uniref:RNA polymerase sigma-70 factor (ECF subfamily) n=1 Tax=Plantactinospora soyae TaxID=1544732 RepID=A0A927MBG1_9ACTN|nr:RNA polymerase sigma factor SigJ [Plantactinospora soyae]MBE1491497.1 RNA polymerase sigma-70 factor (ECF subfamily) [Plantactinospora soyae]
MSDIPPDFPSPSLEGSSQKAAVATAPDTATQVFADHRELLFSIVYNMLGSVADTEDVLQETWLPWANRNQAPTVERVENPRAYLVRVAVNRALAHRATVSRRRETYVGPWLPEPLVGPLVDTPITGDAADAAVRAESVSMALLVVLETLTPLERAVFVLHEVFGYAHTEIADILGRSPSAVRQLAHRAREHVQARRPRFQADPRVRQQVTERFLAAALGGDLDALLQLLAPEVTLWSDGGGRTHAGGGLRPVHGRDKVARLLLGIAARFGKALDVVYRSVNGDPSALLFADDTPYAVIVLDLTPDGGQVRGIYSVANPDKLSHVN